MNDMCEQRIYAISLSLLILIPLSLIKNLTKFKAASSTASIIMILALFAIFFYSLIVINN